MKNNIFLIGWAIVLSVFLVAFNELEAGTTPPVAESIEGIQWQLAELSGVAVSPSAGGVQRPFVTFDAARKQVTGFAGCNNFFGSYERDGTSLKFGPIGSTRMSCPDLQMSLETEFFMALEKTRAWRLKDDVLQLHDSEVLARFSKERIDGVTGPIWQWMPTLYSDDRKVVPPDSNNFTVQFREDGTLTVKADCNQKGGTYSVTDGENRISIEITHSTMAVCPEGSLEDEFVRGLSAASIYFLKDGDLYIDLQFDSGTMRFSKKEEQ